ncbi:alpha/beta hydrolase, partial [Streptomyces klenkii]
MSIAELREYREEFMETSPLFGEWMVWGLSGCEGWPVPADQTERPRYAAEDAAEPILLVANTGDPATPYAGAGRMQEAMGGPEVA